MALRKVQIKPGTYVFEDTDSEERQDELLEERLEQAGIEIEKLWRQEVLRAPAPSKRD